MTDVTPDKEQIFNAAAEIDDPVLREAWLRDVCGSDSSLYSEMSALLRHDEVGDSFLNQPDVEFAPTISPGDFDTQDEDFVEDLASFLNGPRKPGCIGGIEHYDVLEVVGRGGMGIVLRAFDSKLNRVVAIKIMTPELAASPTAARRFLREAQAAAAVSHDHVVAIHAIHDTHRPPFIVMEYISGQSLAQKIASTCALSTQEILRIGMQTARGLAAAHEQGLIHRDIKPANILLENGIERVKLTDFGLARAVDDVSMTQTGQIAGTPQYMSPEQAFGHTLDARSDLFSLGSVLYTMCTGHAPFRAETPLAVLRRVTDDTPQPVREANPEVPEWLADMTSRLLAKNPADRIQTAAEVSDLCAGWLAHLQQPESIPQPSSVAIASESTPIDDGTTSRSKAESTLTRWVTGILALLFLTVVSVLTGEMLNVVSADIRARAITAVIAGAVGLLVAGKLLQMVVVRGSARILTPSRVAGAMLAIALPFGSGLAWYATNYGTVQVISDDANVELRIHRLVSDSFDGRHGTSSWKYPAAGIATDSMQLHLPPGPYVAFVNGEVAARKYRPAVSRFVLARGGTVSVKIDRVIAASGEPNVMTVPETSTAPTDHLAPTAAAQDFAPLPHAGIESGVVPRELEVSLRLEGHSDAIDAIAWSDDGRQLLTTGGDKTLRVWDAESGEIIHRIRVNDMSLSMATIPGTTQVVLSHFSSGVSLWDWQSEAHVRDYPAHQIQSFVVVSHDARQIVTGSYDETVCLIELESGEVRHTFHDGYCAAVAHARFAAVAAHGNGQMIRVWDSTTPRKTFCWIARSGDAVTALAVSPDGSLVASGDGSGLVEIWNGTSGHLLHRFPLLPQTASEPPDRRPTVSSLAFFPDGRHVAVGCWDKSLRILDTSRGREVSRNREATWCTSSVAVAPFGRMIASAGGRVTLTDNITNLSDGDFTIRLWNTPKDTQTSQQLQPGSGRSGVLP